MPADFHIEALKAQAIAARTYAYACRERHCDQSFDLCDVTHCQMYLGATAERASTTEAVKRTDGMVAVHNGKLITANFCSDCGGATADGGKPYLVSVSDRFEGGGEDYCEHDSHTWTKNWKLSELESKLKKVCRGLKGLKSLSVTENDPSGRVITVDIQAEEGSTTVSGIKLRSLLGVDELKSTLFTIKVEDDQVTFDGKGYGHGVGLCQFGANGLASSPCNYTFDRILKHYYKDIELVQVSSASELNGRIASRALPPRKAESL
jgi:stage II sporulation protein D